MGGLFFWKRNNNGSGRDKKERKSKGGLWGKSKTAADYDENDGRPDLQFQYEDDDDDAVTGFVGDDERTGYSDRYGNARPEFSSRYEDDDGDAVTGFVGDDERTGYSDWYGNARPEFSSQYEDDDDDAVTGFVEDDERTGYFDRYENAHPEFSPRYEDDDDDAVTGFVEGEEKTGFSEERENTSDYKYSGRLGYMPGMSSSGDEEKTGFREDSHRLMNPSKRQWMPLIVRTMTGENIFVSETPFYIGRSQYRVHFRVNNPQISNMHAVITRKNDTYYLKDTNSLNGTYINGERLEADDTRALYNGMVFELAGETFTVIFRKVEV